MTLTTDQQNAFIAFQEFMKSENQVFLLKGSAGSGKTTLLKMLIDNLKTDDCSIAKNWAFKLMAPTGRAANILREKTNLETSTIHREIYEIDGELSKNENGKLFFKLKENNSSCNTIYFVDEASMVSDQLSDNDAFGFGSGFLLRDLIQYCGHKKIVFVGDYAQLPPVGQNTSYALDGKYLQEEYNIQVQEVMLRQVVRQVEESGIYSNAMKIRDAIEDQSFSDFSISATQDIHKSSSILSDYLQENNKSIDYNSVIITYSNKQALDYNLSLRKHLFGDNPQRLQKNDLLIISRNNYSHRIELFNGTIVKVIDCDNDDQLEKRIVRFLSDEKDDKGKFIVKEVALCFRKVILEVPINDNRQILKCIMLDNLLTDEFGQISKSIFQALRVDFNNRYKEKINTQNYFNELKIDPYFNAIVCRYGYAITCHKAQGGEWEKVFVDMDRFGGKQNSDYFRWAYTAITRSSAQLWHFASPEFNAIHNMVVDPISKGGKMVYYSPKDESFLDWRFKQIQKQCLLNNIKCTENREKQYQHIILFSNDLNHHCTIQFWYNKNSYTGKINILNTNNSDFTEIIRNICEQSMIPEKLLFNPAFEFAKKFHEHIIFIANELNISVLNIRQEQWKDIYYLKTNADVAIITCCYNAQGIYTHVIPQSTDGTDDELLNQFCNKLK